jgi:hypothetical protein
LKDYYNDGSQEGMYDPGVARFIPAFIARQEAYYKDKPESSPWSRAVSAYLGVLDLLVDNLEVEKYSKALLTFIHPRTGSLEGIITLQKLLEALLLKLGVVTDVSSTMSSRSKISASGTIPESTIKTRSSTAVNSRKLILEKYFDSVFDSDLPKQTGYDYLSSDGIEKEPNDDGLLVISNVKFEKRTDEETIKYFKDTTTDINLKTNAKQYTTDDTLLNSKYRFLTPSIVELKGQDKIAMSARGNGLLESKQYESFMSQVMNFNYMKKSPRIPVSRVTPSTTSNLATQDQVTKENLSNVAFAAGIMLNVITPTIPMKVLRATDVVGTGSKFVGENINKEQPTSFGTKTNPEPNATVNPNAMFLSLLMPEMVTGVQMMSVKEIKKDTNTIDNFNLNKKDNFLDRLPKMDIKALPNQIKSLLVSSINSEATKNNFNALATDVVKNPKKSLGYKMNYNMINEVEVLSGFMTVDTFSGFEHIPTGKERLVKSPIWSKLTPEKFAEAAKKNLFCRMRRYANKDMGVEVQNGIELPTYNEYFILSPEEHLNIKTKTQIPINMKIFEVQDIVQKTEKNIFSAATMNMQHANSLITTATLRKPITDVVQKDTSTTTVVQNKTAPMTIASRLLRK